MDQSQCILNISLNLKNNYLFIYFKQLEINFLFMHFKFSIHDFKIKYMTLSIDKKNVKS